MNLVGGQIDLRPVSAVPELNEWLDPQGEHPRVQLLESDKGTVLIDPESWVGKLQRRQ